MVYTPNVKAGAPPVDAPERVATARQRAVGPSRMLALNDCAHARSAHVSLRRGSQVQPS